MTIREHPIIIFLDRVGFIIYQDTLTNVWQFPFSGDCVQNLDVINRESLVNSIGSFIQTNKVIPSTVILILSDSVMFQKDLAPKVPNPEAQVNAQENLSSQSQPQDKPNIELDYKDEQEKEIKNFLDSVPFEEILAKVINNARIVATNKDLLEDIIFPFKKIGCDVNGIVPAFMYQQYIDFSQGLNPDTARIILQQLDLLKVGNMLTDQQPMVTVETQQDISESHQEEPKEKPKNVRQLILIVAFVFLIIVLIIIYLTLGRSQTVPGKKTIPSQPTNPQIIPSPTTAVEAKPTISADLKAIKITIVGNQETEVLANAIKNLLTGMGFEDISTKDSTDPLPAKSSVLFSKSVPDNARQKAIGEIKKIFPDVLVQESQELESGITIILGKSS